MDQVVLFHQGDQFCPANDAICCYLQLGYEVVLFDAPFNPVCFMYETEIVRSHLLLLRLNDLASLMIQKIW